MHLINNNFENNHSTVALLFKALNIAEKSFYFFRYINQIMYDALLNQTFYETCQLEFPMRCKKKIDKFL